MSIHLGKFQTGGKTSCFKKAVLEAKEEAADRGSKIDRFQFFNEGSGNEGDGVGEDSDDSESEESGLSDSD